MAEAAHLTAAGLRAHSRFIAAMRVILPAAIVALAGLLVMFMATHEVRVRSSAPRETASRFHMVNPHFFGRDNQGRAFEISAAEAARSDTDMQVVLLDHVVMALDMNGPNPRHMSADHGVYREDTRILRLTSNVHVDDGRASSVVTNQAIVDTRAGTVTGAQHVASQTNVGSLQAGQYTVLEKGDRVILRGGVHARINSH
jgi:lipopolysaccharide export system protein LptC